MGFASWEVAEPWCGADWTLSLPRFLSLLPRPRCLPRLRPDEDPWVCWSALEPQEPGFPMQPIEVIRADTDPAGGVASVLLVISCMRSSEWTLLKDGRGAVNEMMSTACLRRGLTPQSVLRMSSLS